MNEAPLNPNKAWYIATALGRIPSSKPLVLVIQSLKIVFFRNDREEVTAMEDRCLHRHVSLSLGEVKDNCLVCPYHGARYDYKGECVSVPAQTENHKLPKLKAKTFFTHIDDYGFVWVNLGSEPEAFKSMLPKFIKHTSILKFHYEIEASAISVIENFVDCAHTGFVHKGLFRGEPSKKVQVRVDTTPGQVEIETIGGDDTNSILSKVLNPKKTKVLHIDRYLAPYTVNVLYRTGKKEIETISICTPINATRTMVHTFLFLRGGPVINFLLKPLMHFYTKKILAQDVVILENQMAQIKRYDNPRSSFFATDTAILKVFQAYENFHNDRTGSTIQTNFEMRL